MACWCAQQCGTWWIIPDCTCIVPPTSVMWRETPNRLPYDLQLYYILQPRLLYLQLQHERHLPAIMMPDRNRRLDWGSLCVVCVLCRHQPFEQQWHTASGRTIGFFVWFRSPSTALCSAAEFVKHPLTWDICHRVGSLVRTWENVVACFKILGDSEWSRKSVTVIGVSDRIRIGGRSRLSLCVADLFYFILFYFILQRYRIGNRGH